uniref:Ig-like domain-containing protein n=1 Tax=Daphnia galeata TaxID=27404 RepID=A0A8J2RV47_9CRUS|nr:unnamed protein product [Daphnia galeata]
MFLLPLPNGVRTLLRVLVWSAVICCLAAACPDSCTCKWKGGKQTVECVNKGLIALPEGMDPETQVLDISGSTLQILHRTLFQRYGLVNLQRVYLARSRLGHLDDLTFQGLTNLVELDLSDNMLTSIPVAALSELPALMRLSLARNPVRRVSAESFRNLRYLITLELSQCQIEAVEVGAFDGLKALEWLKLDGNALANIGGSSVLPRSLHGVTLHDNPWRCDCQLSQLRAWLVQFNIPLSMEPKCSQPERLTGRLVKSLDPMDFACAPQITSSVTILEVSFGDNVTLNCQVTGDPDPRVSWFHNGQKITATSSSTAVYSSANETEASESSFYYTFIGVDGSDSQRSVLNIVNATSKENGSYVCTAENRAGSARKNFTLLVQPLPTLPPPPGSIEYVITVGGVVAAIVITMVIIVVAVAVRCCCCRRRSHRTRDKTANNITSIGGVGDSTKTKASSNISPELPPRPIQMLPSSSNLGNKGDNGYTVGIPLTGGVRVGGGGREYPSTALDSTLDQSPDLINDTTATAKWKEQNAVCLDDGQFSPSMYAVGATSSGNGQYYPCSGPQLSTISEAVLQQQQQHFYPAHCSTNPYNSSSNLAVLNPAGYLVPMPMSGLPLVDAEGFPIDYGLPRPSRPTRPTQTHVRFADPPSVSVRHYENYVVDGDNHLQEATIENFLPDRKYPDSYDPLPTSPMNGGNHSEIRYPSERYPQNFSPSSFPVGYNGTGNYEEIIASPPTAYAGHNNQQQQHQQEYMYPPPGQMMKPNSSTSIESSENSTVTLTGGAPSSPLDVSINDASSSSPGFLCSSTLQRQPHESPDEGYEDEGIDGTEI